MFLLLRTAVEGKAPHEIGEGIKQALKKSPVSDQVVKLAPCAKGIVSKKKRPAFLAEVTAVAFG